MTGTVVSTKMKQTVVVQHETLRRHPRYQKLTRHRTKFYAHDDQSVARLGDTVLLEETRPLSKLKRWRLIEVVKKAESPSTRSGQAEQ